MASIVDTGVAVGSSGHRRSRVAVLWRLLRRMRGRNAATIAMRRELTDPRLLADVGVPPPRGQDFVAVFGRELLRGVMRGKE